MLERRLIPDRTLMASFFFPFRTRLGTFPRSSGCHCLGVVWIQNLNSDWREVIMFIFTFNSMNPEKLDDDLWRFMSVTGSCDLCCYVPLKLLCNSERSKLCMHEGASLHTPSLQSPCGFGKPRAGSQLVWGFIGYQSPLVDSYEHVGHPTYQWIQSFSAMSPNIINCFLLLQVKIKVRFNILDQWFKINRLIIQ